MSEKMIYHDEFNVKVDNGDVYINGKFYRQLAWTPNQIGLVIEDYLNSVPEDDDENTAPAEVHEPQQEYTHVTVRVTGRFIARVPETDDTDALVKAAHEQWEEADFGALEDIEYTKMVKDGQVIYEPCVSRG